LSIRHIQSYPAFKAIVNDISKMQLDFGSYEEIITRSLFFWYDCLTMDKICRKFDVNEIPTPHTLRIQTMIL
jgi:hypothetical protein